MDIVEVKDLAALRDFHGILAASHAHDFVALPADPIEEYLPILEGHQPTGQQVSWYTGYEAESPVGCFAVTLFTLDNLATANLGVNVHPDCRGRGIGRKLLTSAIDVVRSAGRTRIFAEAHSLADGTEGPAFGLLRSVGAKPALEDYRRLLDLQAFPVVDPPAAPEGYRVAQWCDRAPEELVDGLAYLLHRMVLDAPMGELVLEPEQWDAARYRDSEQSAIRRQRTRFTTTVVHEGTGELAGMTEVVVNRNHPDIAYQWNTIVDPRHRGHGLGLVLKSWNHRLLVDTVPAVRWINTWNATTNSFMIDVNEALGFRIVDTWTEFQLQL